MKHSLKITIILVLVFLVAQLVGLFVVNSDFEGVIEVEGEKSILRQSNVPEPPSSQENSYLYILGAVFIGTLIILCVTKLKKVRLWKVWFFFSMWICLSYALSVFISYNLALIICLIVAWFRVFRRNFIFNNVVEIFVYSGLAIIFVGWLNVKAVIILLIIISLYDIFAVRFSKHMVKLAKFQIKSKVFAGLLIPYKKIETGSVKRTRKRRVKKVNVKSAILGGGDIGFPLIFTSVVMSDLFLKGFDKISAFTNSLVITACVTIALFLLFYFSKESKFYPAMPFLTGGCLAGYFIITLIV